MKTVDADVAIVGGGIIGCASAYYLSRAGKVVVLLEKGIIGGEASGRNLGGVRQQGRDQSELPLAMESNQLWQHLDEELDCHTEYRRWGNLQVARTDEHLQALIGKAREETRLGLDVHILDRAGLRDLVPALSDEFIGAKYCPSDGHANPILTTLAFAGAARRAGAKVYAESEVRSIKVRAGVVAGVCTQDMEVRTSKVVNAAGAWAAKIGQMVGLELPLAALRNQVMVTEPLPEMLRPFVISAELDSGCRPAVSGNVHIGIGEAVDVDRLLLSHDVTWPVIRASAQRVVKLIPQLARVKVIRSWAGFDSLTPDAVPLIGPVESIQGFILATGFSNHGFALGPAVGKAIKEMIVDQKVERNVVNFSPSRFDLRWQPNTGQ